MQTFWILLLAIQYACSCLAQTLKKTEKKFGDELIISLPPGAAKLKFVSDTWKIPEDYWFISGTVKKGEITGQKKDMKFVIKSVTFDDAGTYIVKNSYNNILLKYTVSVSGKKSSEICSAGQSLRISLGGLSKEFAILVFEKKDFNVTLVENGEPVGNSHPKYKGRVEVTKTSIKLHSVTASDVGDYILKDFINEKVAKVVSMKLVDKRSLAALLLLLGIPPSIFCCCKKCKKSCKETNQSSKNMEDNDIEMNPAGPPPAHSNPEASAGPTPGYTPSYPPMGGNIVHPPPNPAFPPQPPYSGYPAISPAMPPNPNPLYPPVSAYPPAQPPQWNEAPGYQSPPAGFASVTYNASAGPDPVKGVIPPTTPLLTSPQSGVAQNPALDSTVQFNISKGNDSNKNVW